MGSASCHTVHDLLQTQQLNESKADASVAVRVHCGKEER